MYVACAQVNDVAVKVSGQAVVLTVPHSQDLGRFYSFARLWRKPALQMLKAQSQRTVDSLRMAAANLQGTGQDTERDTISAPGAARLASGASHCSTIPDVKPRIKLSVALAEVAVRMEHHPLERRLSIVWPVHMHTAAAMSTLDSAMNEYDRMAKTSAARAAAKKPSIAASMLTQEIQDPSEILDRLASHVLLQDRCVI